MEKSNIPIWRRGKIWRFVKNADHVFPALSPEEEERSLGAPHSHMRYIFDFDEEYDTYNKSKEELTVISKLFSKQDVEDSLRFLCRKVVVEECSCAATSALSIFKYSPHITSSFVARILSFLNCPDIEDEEDELYGISEFLLHHVGISLDPVFCFIGDQVETNWLTTFLGIDAFDHPYELPTYGLYKNFLESVLESDEDEDEKHKTRIHQYLRQMSLDIGRKNVTTSTDISSICISYITKFRKIELVKEMRNLYVHAPDPKYATIHLDDDNGPFVEFSDWDKLLYYFDLPLDANDHLVRVCNCCEQHESKIPLLTCVERKQEEMRRIRVTNFELSKTFFKEEEYERALHHANLSLSSSPDKKNPFKRIPIADLPFEKIDLRILKLSCYIMMEKNELALLSLRRIIFPTLGNHIGKVGFVVDSDQWEYMNTRMKMLENEAVLAHNQERVASKISDFIAKQVEMLLAESASTEKEISRMINLSKAPLPTNNAVIKRFKLIKRDENKNMLSTGYFRQLLYAHDRRRDIYSFSTYDRTTGMFFFNPCSFEIVCLNTRKMCVERILYANYHDDVLDDGMQLIKGLLAKKDLLAVQSNMILCKIYNWRLGVALKVVKINFPTRWNWRIFQMQIFDRRKVLKKKKVSSNKHICCTKAIAIGCASNVIICDIVDKGKDDRRLELYGEGIAHFCCKSKSIFCVVPKGIVEYSTTSSTTYGHVVKQVYIPPLMIRRTDYGRGEKQKCSISFSEVKVSNNYSGCNGYVIAKAVYLEFPNPGDDLFIFSKDSGKLLRIFNSKVQFGSLGRDNSRFLALGNGLKCCQIHHLQKELQIFDTISGKVFVTLNNLEEKKVFDMYVDEVKERRVKIVLLRRDGIIETIEYEVICANDHVRKKKTKKKKKRKEKVCSVCRMEKENMLRCSKCYRCDKNRLVWYCGKDCQNIDWKNGHKKICGK